MLNVRSIVHHFTWNLLENMTNRFPHIPGFAWTCGSLMHCLLILPNCAFRLGDVILNASLVLYCIVNLEQKIIYTIANAQ